MKSKAVSPIDATRHLLDQHYSSFFSVAEIAKETGHPVPTDTRGWSQIVVSTLTGIRGVDRKKGPDLEDGSDVKGANTWEAIDTPRFNNVIKAGTKSHYSDSVEYLDTTPFLFFLLWDVSRRHSHRCRIWVVRPKDDKEFRIMCQRWYSARTHGEIVSTNFQLHPPREQDTNIIRNSYGVLSYPLLLCAENRGEGYDILTLDTDVMEHGECFNAE